MRSLIGILIPIIVSLDFIRPVAPSAASQPDTRQPSGSANEMLQRFVDELIDLRPGHAPFPEMIRIHHRVLAPSAEFRIARYETTQELYQLITGKNPSRWRGPRNAVESMTAADARLFCRQLTDRLQQHGLLRSEEHVRLPAAVEWEYACRAGAITDYCFGNAADAEKQLGVYAWYKDNAAGHDPAVGVLRPNAWGLFDVHGYLWEFVESCPDSDRHSQTGPVSCAMGGSWRDPPAQLTCDSRIVIPANAQGDFLGFRCVVSKTAANSQESD